MHGSWKNLAPFGTENNNQPVNQLRRIGNYSVGVDTCPGVAMFHVDVGR